MQDNSTLASFRPRWASECAWCNSNHQQPYHVEYPSPMHAAEENHKLLPRLSCPFHANLGAYLFQQMGLRGPTMDDRQLPTHQSIEALTRTTCAAEPREVHRYLAEAPRHPPGFQQDQRARAFARLRMGADQQERANHSASCAQVEVACKKAIQLSVWKFARPLRWPSRLHTR